MVKIMNKAVLKIQVRDNNGWRTVCASDSLLYNVFVKFVRNEWKHLPVRVVDENNDRDVWEVHDCLDESYKKVYGLQIVE